jgi:hypothetical protein
MGFCIECADGSIITFTDDFVYNIGAVIHKKKDAYKEVYLYHFEIHSKGYSTVIFDLAILADVIRFIEKIKCSHPSIDAKIIDMEYFIGDD